MTNSVAVLNASYEPISHARFQRAMTLVVTGKAVIEEAIPNKFVRHQHGKFPWPKIIRLLKYVKVPFRYGEVPWTKHGVLKRDNFLCAFCGKEADTVEHIHPQSRGGGVRDWLNTVAACFNCNNRKSDRTLKEAHMKLLWQPHVPMQVFNGRHK